MATENPRRRLRVDPSDLLLEIISIVAAILLALAVNNWVEGRKHAEVVRTSILDIRDELKLNLAQLQAAGPYHHRIYEGFSKILEARSGTEQLSYRDIGRTFVASSRSGFHLMVPEDTAWTIAASSGATQYMNPALRTELTKTYAAQRLMDTLQHQFISAILYSPPAGERNFFYVTSGAEQTLSDLVGLEGQMRARYGKTLRLLDGALR